MPVSLTELLETQGGSPYSTEVWGCPRGQLPSELRAAAPRGDATRLISCAPLATH